MYMCVQLPVALAYFTFRQQVIVSVVNISERYSRQKTGVFIRTQLIRVPHALSGPVQCVPCLFCVCSV